ncbi:GNAT family N-acetyltransferase [Actinokineospora iranica]|uniref:Protein N-acetyltransferase, RimJ/RimL family n=1 Tax=Actinokineospora iranica TaxID=1271860 RepID=A0A1G6WKR8_9PSEU|nr:GNAT family protein [Actinokineospora iranica]SDD66550.1 Protein N-acetyltransferase, RimJ/RimL family [Actinokineospora iranica]
MTPADAGPVDVWTGAKVRLRGVEPQDWEAFMAFDRHSADMRAADRVHPPRSAEGYRRWAAEQATREASDDLGLAIESLADGALVGMVSTSGVDRRAGRFGYGIGIGRAHQRRGYAADAVVLLLRYLFGEQRLHKCEAAVHAYNEPSLALHRALGFRVEGRLRDHEFFAGRHHDVVLFGMTADEFGGRHRFPEVGASVDGAGSRIDGSIRRT